MTIAVPKCRRAPRLTCRDSSLLAYDIMVSIPEHPFSQLQNLETQAMLSRETEAVEFGIVFVSPHLPRYLTQRLSASQFYLKQLACDVLWCLSRDYNSLANYSLRKRPMHPEGARVTSPVLNIWHAHSGHPCWDWGLREDRIRLNNCPTLTAWSCRRQCLVLTGSWRPCPTRSSASSPAAVF